MAEGAAGASPNVRVDSLRTRVREKIRDIRWRVARDRRLRRHRPRHFLAIYAIMHNEAHILREWVDIHLREGFDHIFLVDHGSTDNWRDVLGPHIRAGRVTVKEIGRAPGGHNFLRFAHVDFALDASEWLSVQDLDEFTHATGPVSIRDFLRGLDADVHQVAVPWVAFGTGGNISQPPLVVPYCLRSEDIAARPRLDDKTFPWQAKSLVRSRYVRGFNAHLQRVPGKTVTPTLDNLPVNSLFFVPNSYAEHIARFCILQNHYIHQSLEFYRQKMQRTTYWLDTYRGVKSYTDERFNREDPRLNAVPNTALFEKHRDYYETLQSGGAPTPALTRATGDAATAAPQPARA